MRLNEKLLANTSVASVCALLWIWVVPGTIALRHVLLSIGCIAGIFLIQRNWERFSSPRLSLIPLYTVGTLFIWVGIHYCFFSLNPVLELSEIKGIWLRSIAGCIMASGFAIALCQHSYLRKYFYVSIFAVPLINLLTYLYDCYLNRGFIEPNAFVKFYFAKIETAYFGGIAAAAAVANLIYLLSGKIEKKTHLTIAFCFISLSLVLLSAVLSTTKNGFAIALALCILLFTVILAKVFRNFKGLKKVGFIVLLFTLAMIVSAWQIHKSYTGGWNTVLQDVRVAVDIDNNKQWQFMEGSKEAPLNSLGIPAALNTYSRFAYIAVGVRLIEQYPLGYGSVNRSFNGLQTTANIYHEHTGQVHSGWVDFGLAFGLPGLGIIFLAIISIIYFGIKQGGELPLVALMYCLMLIPFGFIAEISYKQYFEATLFFLAFAATIVSFPQGVNHTYDIDKIS
jgi:hypothetical protein